RRFCRRLRLLNHAEEVVVRIRQDNEVLAWPVSPRIASRPELEQSLYLSLAVVCIEVEVQSTSLAGSPSRDSVQRHVGSSSLRIAKNYPAVCRSFSRNVVQRLLPKRQHLVELVTTDDDRADPHFFLSTLNATELARQLRRPAPGRKRELRRARWPSALAGCARQETSLLTAG